MRVSNTSRRASQSEWQARLEAIRKTPRVIVFGLVILLVIATFTRRLWRLQIVEGARYQVLAEDLRLREEVVSAPRGIIYDCNETPLVRNVPSFKAVVFPIYLPDYDIVRSPAASADGEDDYTVEFSREAEAVLIRLSVLLDMPYRDHEGGERGVRDIVAEGILNGYLYRSIEVARGVDRDKALLIASERLTLPGVSVEIDSIREYPQAALISQVMGYVAPIPGGSEDAYKAKGYEPDKDRIGVVGVEGWYEDQLRGQKGKRLIEEDVQGRMIRVVSTEAEPVPGRNVYLTLDLDLQQFVEEAVRRGMARANSPRGVAIVMRPKTGEILSLVSLPTYDNNLFVRGISVDDWQRLSENVHRPLMNHAISDELPPGSVFKIVVATGALQEGVLDADTRLNCPGTIVLPNKRAEFDPTARDQTFYCWIWRQGQHGSLDVVEGLAQSCDIFFYKAGGGFEEEEFEGLGPNNIARYAELFGFGQPTGVELPGESAGIVPNPTWKRRTKGESWTTGNTYNYAIGQSFLGVTPLQMLDAINIVATGGTFYRPQIVHHVTDYEGNVLQPFEPRVVRTLSAITPTNWSLVQQGLELAVTGGTATGAQIEGIRVAGKTGTAQFCDDIKCGTPGRYDQPEHAWFAAFAPVGDPQISVIVFLYDGGEGSRMAVPVANEIMRHYFNRESAVVNSEE